MGGKCGPQISQCAKHAVMFRRVVLLQHSAPISHHYGNALGAVDVLKESKDGAGLLIAIWATNCFIFDFLMLVMIFQSLVNTSEGQLMAVRLTRLNPGRSHKRLYTTHSDPVRNFILVFGFACLPFCLDFKLVWIQARVCFYPSKGLFRQGLGLSMFYN